MLIVPASKPDSGMYMLVAACDSRSIQLKTPCVLLLLKVEETLSTLSYATRAKNIHNRPTVQYDPREAQIALLRREIELLRQENTLLKEQLRSGGGERGKISSFLHVSPVCINTSRRISGYCATLYLLHCGHTITCD